MKQSNATLCSEKALPTALCQPQNSQGLKHQPHEPYSAPRLCCGDPSFPPLLTNSFPDIPWPIWPTLQTGEFHYLVTVWWHTFAGEQGKKSLT